MTSPPHTEVMRYIYMLIYKEFHTKLYRIILNLKSNIKNFLKRKSGCSFPFLGLFFFLCLLWIQRLTLACNAIRLSTPLGTGIIIQSRQENFKEINHRKGNENPLFTSTCLLLLPAASTVGVIEWVPSFHLCVSVNTLTAEPSDLWPWFLVYGSWTWR